MHPSRVPGAPAARSPRPDYSWALAGLSINDRHARGNPVFASLGTRSSPIMSALATELGRQSRQGFRTEDGVLSVRRAAPERFVDRPNGIPPTMGLPVLRQALARHARRHLHRLRLGRGCPDHFGRDRALADCLMALLSPAAGDPDQPTPMTAPPADHPKPSARAERGREAGRDGWRLLDAIAAAVTARTQLIVTSTRRTQSVGPGLRTPLEMRASPPSCRTTTCCCSATDPEHLTFDGLTMCRPRPCGDGARSCGVEFGRARSSR